LTIASWKPCPIEQGAGSTAKARNTVTETRRGPPAPWGGVGDRGAWHRCATAGRSGTTAVESGRFTGETPESAARSGSNERFQPKPHSKSGSVGAFELGELGGFVRPQMSRRRSLVLADVEGLRKRDRRARLFLLLLFESRGGHGKFALVRNFASFRHTGRPNSMMVHAGSVSSTASEGPLSGRYRQIREQKSVRTAGGRYCTPVPLVECAGRSHFAGPRVRGREFRVDAIRSRLARDVGAEVRRRGRRTSAGRTWSTCEAARRGVRDWWGVLAVPPPTGRSSDRPRLEMGGDGGGKGRRRRRRRQAGVTDSRDQRGRGLPSLFESFADGRQGSVPTFVCVPRL